MNFDSHPLMQNVRTFSPSSDERKNAERMARELDDLFTTLAGMQPNDPAAESTLRQALSLAHSITQHFGSIGGWTGAQHARIYIEANRLLGPGQLEFNQPNLQEP